MEDDTRIWFGQSSSIERQVGGSEFEIEISSIPVWNPFTIL